MYYKPHAKFTEFMKKNKKVKQWINNENSKYSHWFRGFIWFTQANHFKTGKNWSNDYNIEKMK